MGTTFIILLSTVLPIGLTVLFLVKTLGGLQREQKETERILASGQPAQGRVVNLAHGGETVAVMGHRHVRLSVILEVHLPGRSPYQAQIQPLISELMLPSLQPGAVLQLRADAANPQNIAIAGAGAAAAPSAPMPMGGPPAPWPAPAFAPPNVGGAMKKTAPFMIVMLLVTTVPVAGIMLYTFVDLGAIFGTGDGPKGGWCKAAAQCCKVIGQGASACNSYANGMPVEGCKLAYESYKESATAMKKKCE